MIPPTFNLKDHQIDFTKKNFLKDFETDRSWIEFGSFGVVYKIKNKADNKEE